MSGVAQRWQWRVAAAIMAIALLGGWTSAARAATNSITPITLSADNDQAGGSPKLTTALTFGYATSGDTAQSVSVALPPGMQLAPAAVTTTCSSSELTAHTCPSASVIGTGTATLTTGALLSSPTGTAAITLYEMAAPTSADIGGIGAEFTSSVTLTTAAVASGPIDVISSPTGQPETVVTLNGLPASFPLLGLLPEAVSLTSLSLTFNGQSTTGAAYTRLPDSCTAVSGAALMTTVDKATATGETVPLTPTGCSSLAYAPTLTAAATRDPSDSGVQLLAEVTQAAGEATSKSIALTLPSAIVPNPGAAGELCSSPTATFSNCTKLGAVSLSTPLVSSPLLGGVYLTGTSTAPSLTLAFPAPFPFTITGAISGDKITFNPVPDVPLTRLVLFTTSGTGGLFATTCAANSGTASAAFIDQNGDKTATANATLNIAGCPSTTPSPPPTGTAGPPHLTAHSVTVTSKGKATLSFTLAAGTNAPGLAGAAIQLPSGLSPVASNIQTALTASGASIKTVSIIGGKLVLAFTALTTKVTVRIGSSGLSVAKSLLPKTVKVKVKKHGKTKIEHKKTKFTLRSERYTITAIDGKGTQTVFSESGRV
ncbi:MAG TPA: hypothetical protein VG223_02755 [Solirubrobacteraceae bacterium]|nr:hypothetical protein [Solirubrobacteraceae bacterium]